DGQRIERPLAPKRDQGHDHGESHSDHAVAVARLAGDRAGKASERQDEQNAGEQIEDCGEVGVHFAPPFFSGVAFFLYMASIRRTTRKPPKMLTEARAAATAPAPLETRIEPVSAWSAPWAAPASNAPTMIT